MAADANLDCVLRHFASEMSDDPILNGKVNITKSENLQSDLANRLDPAPYR